MRNYLSKKINWLTFLFILSAQSCNYRSQKNNSDKIKNDPEFNIYELNNNYESIQQTVISRQCLSCHSVSGGDKGNLNLESYSMIKKNLSQIAFRVLEKKDMPYEGLSDSDFQLIKLWIDSGAPEKNISTGVNKPIVGPIDWLNIKNNIFIKNCLDCHSGSSSEANLDLTNYENVKINLSKIIDRTIIKQDMPPEPYSNLTSHQKLALLKWISQGLPK